MSIAFLPMERDEATTGRLALEVGGGRQRFASRAERDAAIVEMAKAGLAPVQIEEQILASRQVIYNALTAARRRGLLTVRFSTGGSQPRRIDTLHAVLIRGADFAALAAPAAARRMTTPELARVLIETIVDENLVDAVLDDDGGQL